MKKQSKQKFLRTLCMLLTIVSLFTLSVPAFAATPALPNGIYVFYSINKTMGLNVLYKQANGALLGTDKIDGEANEIYILEAVGVSEFFTLRPWHAKNCYVSGNGKGENLTLKSGIPSDRSAHWKAIPIGNNQYVIANRADPSLVIDCCDGLIDEEFTGNPYILWNRNNYAPAQSFYPVRISEKTNKLTPSNRIYPKEFTCSFVVSANQSMAINAQYAKGAGTPVVLDNLSNPAEKNEVVVVTPVKNGLYRLSFQHSPDTCISASDIFPDSRIVLSSFNKNDPYDLWEIYKVGNGFSFRNAGNLLMFDNLFHRGSVANAQISYSYTGGDPQIYFAKQTSSSSSSSSDANESAALQKLNEMMNGSYNGQFKLNTRYRGQYASQECKGFARDVFLKLFGASVGSTCNKPNNYKLNSSSQTKLVASMTSLSSKSNSSVCNTFEQAKAGCFIQLRRSHGGSHSAIYLSSSDSGITLYECNVDGRNGIIKRTYDWKTFRNDNQAFSIYSPKNYKLK